MRSRDWSLVFFTVLSQWSIGIMLCSTSLDSHNPVVLALLLIGVATISSFLHLGKPSNAPGALNNLAGSWLSREILAIGIFSICLLLTLFSGWITGGTEYPGYLLLLCSIAGLFLLWAMARVYLIPTIPSWNSWYTPVSFALTTLCLGLMTLLLLDGQGPGGAGQHVRFYAALLVAALALEIVSALLHHQRLKGMDTGIDGPAFQQGTYYRLFLTRLALLLFSCLALLFLLLQAELSAASNFNWVYPVLALVFVQELASRALFYMSYFRLGV